MQEETTPDGAPGQDAAVDGKVAPALGRPDSADRSLAELRRRWAGRYPTELAEIYAYRGETERALAALDAAFLAGDPAVNSIRVDSYFRPLESDRRYQVLLQRLNLAQSAALF